MNKRARWGAVVALGVVAALAFTGCAKEEFAQQYAASADQGYVSGDGSWEVFPAGKRAAPVAFSGTTETGSTFTSAEYTGKVLVVNFWYAACPPCRAEAADLQSVNSEYSDDAVQFVGVNVYDQAATAQSFMNEFKVSYPSILDVQDAKVRLAFAANVSPQAIPSTLVLDREGSVAAVIRGVADPGVLSTMIDDVLAE